jgi:hypothetical protein
MRNSIIALCLLLAPALVFAEGKRVVTPLGTLLSDVAMNGAAATMTFYIGRRADCGYSGANSCSPTSTNDNSTGAEVSSYTAVGLEIDFDYTAQAGAITLTCTEGQTRATATGRIPTATLASGTYTLAWSGVVTSPSLSADTIWYVEFNLGGAPVTKCVMSHGGTPGATDTITVTGWLIAD